MNSNILPLLALILAVGIFFGYVNPTWSGSVALTKTEIANNKLALSAADEYKKKQNALASAQNAIDQSDLDRLSTFLPDAVDNVGLILDINAVAARSGLSLENIDVMSNDQSSTDGSAIDGALPIASVNLVGSIDLVLSAIGTYSALQVFLSEIEKSVRLLDIRDITVRGSDTGVYNYKMTVRLYWLR